MSRRWIGIGVIVLCLVGCTNEMEMGGEGGTESVALPAVDSTYLLDPTVGTWVQPPNGAQLIMTAGSSVSALLTVETASDGMLSVLVGATSDMSQDYCSQTLSVSGVSVDAQRGLNFGPRDLTLANGLVIEQAQITGTFTEDFGQINNVSVSGLLDLDTVDASSLPESFRDDLCGTLSSLFMVDCVNCADGMTGCVALEVSMSTAMGVSSGPLEAITQSSCHAMCAMNADDCML